MCSSDVSNASQTTEIHVVFTPADDLPCPPNRAKAAEIANMMLNSLRLHLEGQIMRGMFPVGYRYRTRDKGELK